jgi:renalase
MNYFNNKIYDTIIIGAGIAGITAGNYLQQKGLSVLLLDKGKGIGGRMATRRINFENQRVVFDYGAKYLEGTSDKFEELISWLSQNAIITKWNGIENLKRSPKFIGKKSMREAAIFLAKELNILNSTKVIEVKHSNQYWELTDEAGNVYRSKTLLLTLPVPQALDLLVNSQISVEAKLYNSLRRIQYERSIVGLFVADGSINLDGKGGIYFDKGPISFITDNNIKGINSYKSAISIEMANSFSIENWDKSNNELSELIWELSKEWIRSKILDYQIHKWKFSKPLVPYGKSFELIDSDSKLFIAGDAFGGNNIESAYLSGLSAAEQIYDEKEIIESAVK